MDNWYDVIIVGTGVSGLYAALQLPENYRILMITKDEMENCDSYLAQGGICCMLGDKDYDQYYEDTMKAGHYENNPDSVRLMLRNSERIIQDLIDYGVEFERDEEGNLLYTREGAHSRFRILYHKDVTGKEITSKLIARVKERPNIEIRTFTTMIDIIEDENGCKGIVAVDKEDNKQWILAKQVVLATGGIGGLFKHSTNFRHLTGDAFAIALRHNVELENLHYIQIHPTTLYSGKPGRRFLISESVRGEGAVLLNGKRQRFVNELLPRDVVTAAIKDEMEKEGSDHVYLSIKHLPKEEIVHRFPNIYQKCLEEGYDMSKEPIPVTPAQHYLMGGIRSNTEGESSMKGLYIVGEAACNGVHGANRLASNSLLESLVFAGRAAEKIVECQDSIPVPECTEAEKKEYPSGKERTEDNRKLVLDEIKRKDGVFYAKWCNDEA